MTGVTLRSTGIRVGWRGQVCGKPYPQVCPQALWITRADPWVGNPQTAGKRCDSAPGACEACGKTTAGFFRNVSRETWNPRRRITAGILSVDQSSQPRGPGASFGTGPPRTLGVGRRAKDDETASPRFGHRGLERRTGDGTVTGGAVAHRDAHLTEHGASDRPGGGRGGGGFHE